MIRMPKSALRLVRIACLVACGVGAALFLMRFPWREIPPVLARANPEILWIALVINLSSLVAKGSAWYFLLRPASPCGWRAAQEANLLGTAMNSVSVSVIGETARVQDLAIREGIPVGSVAASVVRVRAVEALALAGFMMLAPALLRLPPILHGIQILGGGLILALIAAAWSGRFVGFLKLFPLPVRTTLSRVTETGSAPLFVAALLLALFNWVAQWAAYHLVLAAFGIPITLSGSFTALIVTNLSGLFRVTPGNVGVTQAALIVSLLPFGVRPHEALAAGLALQAVQILPVLAIALVAIGGRELAVKVARGAAPP
jgi:uncharacterized membrane protein YbhN (UPF0104 family)